MERSELRLRVEDDGDFVRVTLAGEFDIASTAKVDACLLEVAEGNRDVLIDIGEVTFMDSKALALLIRASSDALEGGWRLGITEPRHAAVVRLFELTDAERLLPLRSDSDIAACLEVSNAPE